jgi:hypothetical protein
MQRKQKGNKLQITLILILLALSINFSIVHAESDSAFIIDADNVEETGVRSFLIDMEESFADASNANLLKNPVADTNFIYLISFGVFDVIIVLLFFTLYRKKL